MDIRLKQGLEAGTLPRDLLIEGPAGTGKTYGTLATLHTLAKDYANLRVLLCRQTRASLTESVLATFEEEVLPADGAESIASGERRDHRSSYRYPNGSRIVLGGLDKPDRIKSTAWDVVFVNEATEAKEEGWDMLGSRLNRPGRDPRFGFLIGDTNPGDPAHWLKKRCDDGRTASWKTTHAANPALFDKAGWTPAWGRYLGQLDRLRGLRRKRLLEGLWVAGEGAWFATFDATIHVSDAAEFDPLLPVYLAVDTGVHTGAVWFQLRPPENDPTLSVFADYYSYNVPPYDIGLAVKQISADRCGGRVDVGRHDPAGNAKSGFGGTTIATEYQRAGLFTQPWAKGDGCASAGLALLESFVATTPPRFVVHSRCLDITAAMANYKRKQRGGQYTDAPEDPQHPYEETVDALRSALHDKWPSGRVPAPKLRRVNAGRIF